MSADKPSKVRCPRCRVPGAMQSQQTVCWTCYRQTERLALVPTAHVQEWDRQRIERQGWDASSPSLSPVRPREVDLCPDEAHDGPDVPEGVRS